MTHFHAPSRRGFLAASATAVATASKPLTAELAPPHQATGVKVGEVTDSTAIIWTRLTAQPTRRSDGPDLVGRPGKDDSIPTNVAQLRGACPGAPGFIQVEYATRADFSDGKAVAPVAVNEKTDYSHQFLLTQLPADTVIHYRVQTWDREKKPHGPLAGQFRTAPQPADPVDITFAVVTCQMYSELDHVDGFHIYPAIGQHSPRFVVFTGDNVYYDNEKPRAVTAELARYHWERMYSLPRHIDLLRRVATYWQKDDHDLLKDDCWPGQTMGDLTFEEGQRIFRQQVPMGRSPYRSFRWGQFVQLWLMEGRDFRSPNNIKDGPEKTIWGADQKAWLFRTLRESEARWKVIISPTPIVGPDRVGKGDNHANKAFQTEGDEIRAFLKKHVPHNAFVVCGDRHWQYHSVHPTSGLHEFSVGPASDRHAGGTPGENKDYHRFHRVLGGFLTTTAAAKNITFRHHDVHGKVVYEKTLAAE
jgi:alkaline phosphatase D